MNHENPELTARIEALEHPENQGESFDLVTWCQIVVGCLIVPAIVLTWGLLG